MCEKSDRVQVMNILGSLYKKVLLFSGDITSIVTTYDIVLREGEKEGSEEKKMKDGRMQGEN